ncbi:unnamed protein product [Protopolystoma xenopodis]|uniref:Uncharacterized protein n=1 Tax=Protopolystoma xenopodis TaxID=117903 RepID=A0A448WGT2_9PLAT|nr:unnamed protein product [Protopolystoma xenopodis]
MQNLLDLDPRAHAVLTESYGVLTRRHLEWHPDNLLCKRFNVPNPYPNSDLVGCPGERRVRIQDKRAGRWARSAIRREQESGCFSLFSILDVHCGSEEASENLEADQYKSDGIENKTNILPESNIDMKQTDDIDSKDDVDTGVVERARDINAIYQQSDVSLSESCLHFTSNTHYF